MKRPESVFVDGQRTLYIADPVVGALFVLDAEDNLVRTLRLQEPVRGVGANDTELFVLGDGRVYVYSKRGGQDPLRWFGGRGDYPGEINAYQGITVTDDTVYIADAANHRIEAFTTQGAFLWANPTGIASAETTATTRTWSLPQDLTLDGANHLVIVDALKFELSQASAKDGTFIDAWGTFGSADGQFAYPSSVAYDARHDRFIVADTKNNRVQIVTLPNSSTGVQNVMKRVEMGPWRYIFVPIGVVLLLILVAFVVYRLYWRHKSTQEDGE
jgi:sugar lactone lactonase YvrE